MVVLMGIVGLSAFAYGPDLGMPFVGDDYVFLDEVRDLRFVDIWSRQNVAFRWYRPWSRELHFWALDHLAGPSPTAFRLVGLLLWVGALMLYRELMGRLVPPGGAALATLGVASLALWGTPLLWVSGSQDLWLLIFTLLFLLLVAHRQDLSAAGVGVLALLSKETAVVLPLLGLAFAVAIQRDSWRSAGRRMLPAFVAATAWLALHPTLRDRVFHPIASDAEIAFRPSHLVIGVMNVLATVNLSVLPRPFEVTLGDIIRAVGSSALLCICAWLVLRRDTCPPPSDGVPSRRGVSAFLIAWAVLGWVPTHAPSIGWHPYYGCLGALGAWGLIAMWLSRRRPLAVAVLLGLTLLRAADAKTLTWDWGNEWYLRRAGSVLTAIEQRLKLLHPTVRPHTRIFFGRLPNNIGLVAGQSAAVRIWYDDSTLTADFLSNYTPRTRPGHDLFFRFDTLEVLMEIVAGPSADPTGPSANPEWADDHVKLAMLFLRAGEPARAADEFEKVSLIEPRVQEALYAAVCRRLAGQDYQAESLLVSFGMRTGLGRDSVLSLAENLERAAPAGSRAPATR